MFTYYTDTSINRVVFVPAFNQLMIVLGSGNSTYAFYSIDDHCVYCISDKYDYSKDILILAQHYNNPHIPKIELVTHVQIEDKKIYKMPYYFNVKNFSQATEYRNNIYIYGDILKDYHVSTIQDFCVPDSIKYAFLILVEATHTFLETITTNCTHSFDLADFNYSQDKDGNLILRDPIASYDLLMYR